MFATDIPLSAFENEHWENFFKALRPAFKVPSTYCFSTPLLNAEHERIKTKCEEKIEEATSVCILTDGWSNIRGENVVNFVVTTPEPVFIEAVEPGEDRETGKWIFDAIEKVIKKFDSKKVMGVCTDNASSMKLAHNLISAKYPHISCYGCAAHGLNLLVKDILGKVGKFSSILKNSKTIVKDIKNHHVPHAIFKKKQKIKFGSGKGKSLKLPGKTRWSGTTDMLKSLLENKSVLQETVIDQRVSVSKKAKTTVLDDDFWDAVKCGCDLLSPITDTITYLEGDSANVADVVTALAKMKTQILNAAEDFNMHDMVRVEELVKKRCVFIVKPVHLAANLLHPIYRGKVLTPNQIQLAITFISEMCTHLNYDCGLVISNLARFRNSEGIWAVKETNTGSFHSIWSAANHCTPSSWWKGICADEPLCPLACRILSLPASAAACERVWSGYSNTHTKKRNKLAVERVTKLVQIKSNLKLFSSVSSGDKPKMNCCTIEDGLIFDVDINDRAIEEDNDAGPEGNGAIEDNDAGSEGNQSDSENESAASSYNSDSDSVQSASESECSTLSESDDD
ncbi:uncharacterized protein LOC113212587 [Frankliniella occidentalis]|uniref:Uncharacterized protein LOC113212587 n=1 Tax=Frankliniella occidentalis TaxID=133901 RepID=A0A9C6X783_FRAOC|nr:uncharacterized protein LOC113212587 [Frankliniella occidentalis]